MQWYRLTLSEYVSLTIVYPMEHIDFSDMKNSGVVWVKDWQWPLEPNDEHTGILFFEKCNNAMIELPHKCKE